MGKFNKLDDLLESHADVFNYNTVKVTYHTD